MKEELNVIKELQAKLEEMGLKCSQNEVRTILKSVEETMGDIYAQMDLGDTVSFGAFLIDKKLKKGRTGKVKFGEGKDAIEYSTEDKEVVKVRLKKSVAKRIQGE